MALRRGLGTVTAKNDLSPPCGAGLRLALGLIHRASVAIFPSARKACAYLENAFGGRSSQPMKSQNLQ